ncbi:NTE family protein [Mariniflexile fucanivorans]|uniref:NTE family protein n=1 Tax=Mariniflexile fucanivorans TaxID=264023 RepID=A0A4R1RR69_9FLAO|nr:patatin-like phospholipase family protein [Mariniflexile fucanivorans]TCL68908.1 NTE family protein [Mariniflexile fucanivorans]
MKTKIIISALFMLVLFSAKAQNDTLKNSTPKIGLVLSGGGAKGLAHIGVLKVIDSLGIKIDYVAGTSMGSIIGALYASRYTGKQLDSIFKEIDFDNLINDELPRASKAFYERNNSEKYGVTLPFDNFKIKLPSALSRGQNTYGLFLRLTLHVSEINKFDELPIPFFCIATNIETGKAVILDSGNLAQSIMASGALPSLFQPVNINGQILIDGGVANNYPVDELRAKGMDIIIGVDVQDGLATRDELTSAPDVLVQINNFRTINDMKLKVKKTDIYIKPDIKDYSVVSFDEGSKIIESGKQATLENIDALKKLMSSNFTEIKSKVNCCVHDSISINNIFINGNSKYTRSYILGKLKLKTNEKITYNYFNKGINNLVATNNFDSFEYELKKSVNKEGYDLTANLVETKTTTFLKFGLHYDDLYKSGALVNLTKKRWLFDNDVASLDVVLGDNVRYNFEYFIDRGFYWSIGLKSRYNQFNKNISAKLLLDDAQMASSELNKIDAKLQDQTNQIYIQTLFRKYFSIGAGLEHKRLEIKTETLTANNQTNNFIFENTDYLSVFGGLKLDTYDNKYFPKKGLYFDGDLHMYLYASSFNENFDNFSIAKANMGYAFSVSDKLAFNLQTGGGFKVGDKSTQKLDFALGGYGNNLINNFVPFVGYDFVSITGNSYVKAFLSADYEIFKKQHITLEGNWANVDDDIFETGEWLSLPNYNGYALGYAIETFLGPIQAKFSYSPELRQSYWFFNVGFWF